MIGIPSRFSGLENVVNSNMAGEEAQNAELLPSRPMEEAVCVAKKKPKIPSLKGRRDNAIQG